MLTRSRRKTMNWMVGSLALMLTAGSSGCSSGSGTPTTALGESSPATSTSAAVAVPASQISSVDGVEKVALLAGSTVTQTISGQGNLSGLALTLPPGSLPGATEVSIGSGPQLTDTLHALGGEGAAASAPVVLTSSAKVDPIAPFTVSLVLPVSLRLDGGTTNYAVVYRAVHYTDGKVYDGALTGANIQVANGICTFATAYFGAFQVVSLKTAPTAAAPVAEQGPAQIVAQAPTAAFSTVASVTGSSSSSTSSSAPPAASSPTSTSSSSSSSSPSNTASTTPTPSPVPSTPAAPAPCGGVASGAYAMQTKYQAAVVAYGTSCVSETQTALCTSGSLGAYSGSFTFATCQVLGAPLPPNTVTISSTAAARTTMSPIPVSVTFASAVTGFDLTKVVLGGTAGSNAVSLSGSGANYTFNITPFSDGTITVDINAGAGFDQLQNPSAPATQLSRVYDATPPVPGNAGAFTLTGISSTSVSFQWSAAVDAVSDAAHVTYQIYQINTDSVFGTPADVVSHGISLGAAATNVTSKTVTGLTPNTVYHFNVVVTDETGNQAVYADLREPTPALGATCSDGAINAIADDGVMTYIGGTFSTIGICSGAGAPLSLSTGLVSAPAGSMPAVTGTVRAVVADGSGGWYIGGNFTNVGTVARTNLAHINADYSIGSFDPQPSSGVTALALVGSTLYVGGNFTTIGGQTRNNLAAVDTTNGTSSAWDPEPSSTVSTIVVAGNTVYVGGAFTTSGPGAATPRSHLASYDLTSSGALTSWDPNANGSVNALALVGSTMYVGGTFTSLNGGTGRTYAAAVDATTGTVTTWAPTVSALVNAITTLSGTIYIGGNFTAVASTSRSHAAALDASGNLLSWNPNMLGNVYALTNDGTNIYLSGNFIQANNQRRTALAAFDQSSNLLAWDPEANNVVYAMAVSGSNLYAGGTMTLINGVARSNLAAVDAAGEVTAWNPGASGTVYALATANNMIYVGGTFAFVGNQMHTNLGAVDRSGKGSNGFGGDAEGNGVYSLAVAGNVLIAGGSFTAVGGNPAANIGSVSLTTGTATASTWGSNSATNGIVYAVGVSGSTVYASGAFTTLGGLSRPHLGAVDLTTGTPTAWDPDADATVSALVVTPSLVYIGGAFANVGGIARSHVAVLDSATGSPTSWSAGTVNSNVTSLALSGNNLFLGGNFSSVNGSTRIFFAELDATSAAVSTFAPNPNSPVLALYVGSSVYAGGSFTLFEGATRSLAAFDAINDQWAW